MVLDCSCGRQFRIADHAPAVRRECPECGSVLRADAGRLPMEDLRVLKEKERALRDALRQRERQLRQAQIRITQLSTEVERLRSPQPQSVVISAAWRPMELPSDRLDVGLLSSEASPGSSGAPALPSDRIPLYPLEEESKGAVAPTPDVG